MNNIGVYEGQSETEKQWNQLFYQGGNGVYYSNTRNQWLNIDQMEPHHLLNAIKSIERKVAEYRTILLEEKPAMYEIYRNTPIEALCNLVSPAYADLKREARRRGLITQEKETIMSTVETSAPVAETQIVAVAQTTVPTTDKINLTMSPEVPEEIQNLIFRLGAISVTVDPSIAGDVQKLSNLIEAIYAPEPEPEPTPEPAPVAETPAQPSLTPIESVTISASVNTQKRIVNTLKLNGINNLEDLANISLLDFACFWLATEDVAWNLRQALAAKGLKFADVEASDIFKSQIAWPESERNNAMRDPDDNFIKVNIEVARNLYFDHWVQEDWIKNAHLLFERVKARLLTKATILGKQVMRKQFNLWNLGPTELLAGKRKEVRKEILKQATARIRAMNLDGDMNDRVTAYVTRNVDDVVDAILEG